VLPYLRSGGVLAFHDLDMSVDVWASPPSRLHTLTHDRVRDPLLFAGVDVTAGPRLHQTFLDAGLRAPELQAHAMIGGTRPFIEEFTEWVSGNVRTLLPLLVKGGFATAEEVGIETLRERYLDELLQQQCVIRSRLMVGGWTRKP
jgi:hypothetical protein